MDPMTADSPPPSPASRPAGGGGEDDLCLSSIEDVAASIRDRRLSPVEVVTAVLARIERLQPVLNAYLTVTADRATAAAREAEREIAAGRYRGPLHGVPIALKDLVATAGVRTTAGSKILADWVPDADAPVAAALDRAGAVCLGKLGMHEFAYGTTSDNVHYGPVRNPWDTDRVPGGSSGGSGAATAAGLAYGTLGSDTGGSIRIPASECGCVGLMPTYGRVSLRDVVPLSWNLDHVGPLTRTVRDAAIMLQAIAGPDPLDPSTVDRPVPDWLAGIEAGAAGLRVGVPRAGFWDRVGGDVAAPLRAALETLAAAGATLVDVELPAAELYSSSAAAIIAVEPAAYHAENYPARRGEYGIGERLGEGAAVSSIEYAAALRVLTTARAGAADAGLDGVDVLAVPTMPAPPPTFDEVRSGSYPVRDRTVFTKLFDLTGQPVLTVPCGLTAGGLPTGISFVGRRWDEAAVLRAGRAYETARGTLPAPPLP